MVEFVNETDADWSKYLHRQISRKRPNGKSLRLGEYNISPNEELSYVFETIIQDILGSHPDRLAKRTKSKSRVFFREIDVRVELEHEVYYAEIKTQLERPYGLGKAQKQLDSFIEFLGDLDQGKKVYTTLIIITNKVTKETQEGIELSDLKQKRLKILASSIFDYGLTRGYFDNKNLLQLAKDGVIYFRKENDGVFKFGEQPPETLGDLFGSLKID